MNTGYARRFELELKKTQDAVVTILTYSMIAQPGNSMKIVPPGFTPYADSAALAADDTEAYLAKVNAFLAAIANIDADRKLQLYSVANFADPVNCSIPVIEEIASISWVQGTYNAQYCWTGLAQIDFGDGRGLQPSTGPVSWVGTPYAQQVFTSCFFTTGIGGVTCPMPAGYSQQTQG